MVGTFGVFLLYVFVVGSGTQNLLPLMMLSSIYSSKSFAADLATAKSGALFDAGLVWYEAGNCFGCARYWCSAGWTSNRLWHRQSIQPRAALWRKHGRGEIVSRTGNFASRRELVGLNLHWSYAPAEVKLLTSTDGGNFEEAAQWRQISRCEPSFEESIRFAAPVAAKAVTVLMHGAKPWGYFGIARAAAIAGPSAFMLVSGAPAPQEQCVVSSAAGSTLAVCSCGWP